MLKSNKYLIWNFTTILFELEKNMHFIKLHLVQKNVHPVLNI